MRRFGLIGRPLGHSASAAYFTEKFNREGINDCEYSLYELGAIGDLPGLLERLPELCGLNVTIPYKRDVMAFLDSVSPEAEACAKCTFAHRIFRVAFELHHAPITYMGEHPAVVDASAAAGLDDLCFFFRCCGDRRFSGRRG